MRQSQKVNLKVKSTNKNMRQTTPFFGNARILKLVPRPTLVVSWVFWERGVEARSCCVILHPWVATITVAIFSANYLALIFSCNHHWQPPNSQLDLQIWKYVNKLTTIKCDFINKHGNELPLCPFCFPNKGCWAHWGRYVGSKIKAKTRVTIKSQISSHAPTI